MCGIVGAVAQRDVANILVMGLQSLEYRGYDSAGVATINGTGGINRIRRVGKVQSLACLLYTSPSPRDATLSRMPSSA